MSNNISRLYLAVFLPDRIYFKTVSTGQTWCLSRDSATSFRLYLNDSTSKVTSVPACFPSPWLFTYGGNASSFYRSDINIQFEEIIDVFKDPDIEILEDKHPSSFISILQSRVRLAPIDVALADELKLDCKAAILAIKTSGLLGKFTAPVRLSPKKGTYSQFINITFNLKDAPRYGSVNYSSGMNIEVHIQPFQPNAVSIRMSQDPVELFNDPHRISKAFNEFKLFLKNKGYSVE